MLALAALVAARSGRELAMTTAAASGPPELSLYAAARLGAGHRPPDGARPILRALAVTWTSAGKYRATLCDRSGATVEVYLGPRPCALVPLGALQPGDVVSIVDCLSFDVTPPGGGAAFPCVIASSSPSLDPRLSLAHLPVSGSLSSLPSSRA